MGSSSHILQK